jgi:hypothetical protein
LFFCFSFLFFFMASALKTFQKQALETARVKMGTWRNKSLENETFFPREQASVPLISNKLFSSLIVFVGCSPDKGDIRYKDTGFEYRLPGTKASYAKEPKLLEYMHDLIANKVNSGGSVWGADVVVLGDQASREAKVLEKLSHQLTNIPLFHHINDTASRLQQSSWEDPFSISEMDVIVPAVVTTPSVSTPPTPVPRKKRSRVSTAEKDDTDDDAADSDYSASGSSDCSDDDVSDDDGAQEHEGDAPAARATTTVVRDSGNSAPEAALDWLDKIWQTTEAHDNISSEIDTFRREHMPKNSNFLKGASRVYKASAKVPAQKTTCDFARKILQARKTKLDSVGTFLSDPANFNSRSLNVPQRTIVQEGVAMMNQEDLTLCKVIVGAPVGVGKTSATAALVSALHKGCAPQINAPDCCVVIAPLHLKSQWEDEFSITVPRVHIVRQDEDESNFAHQLERSFLNLAKACEETTDLKVLVLPSHAFNNDTWKRIIHRWLDMFDAVLVVDEFHLIFKRVNGKCGGNMADLNQWTPMHKLLEERPRPTIFISATPLSNRNQALSVLLGMGLQTVLPSEIMDRDKDSVAQAILDAFTIKPTASEAYKVPPYPIYTIISPPPCVDQSLGKSAAARQFVGFNGVDESSNPVIHHALACAIYMARKMNKNVLFYYDNVAGLEALEAAVKNKEYAYLFHFLHGNLSAKETKARYDAMKASKQNVILMSTPAKIGTGTNLGEEMDIVIFCAPMFGADTLLQCAGRVARYPNIWSTVVVYMFISQDRYSLRMQTLREKKTKGVDIFTGERIMAQPAALLAAAARDGEAESEGSTTKPPAKLEQIFPIVTALYVLAQGEETAGFALNLSSKAKACFELAPESQLQPPCKKEEARAQFKAMLKCLEEAKQDAENSQAAQEKIKSRRESLEIKYKVILDKERNLIAEENKAFRDKLCGSSADAVPPAPPAAAAAVPTAPPAAAAAVDTAADLSVPAAAAAMAGEELGPAATAAEAAVGPSQPLVSDQFLNQLRQEMVIAQQRLQICEQQHQTVLSAQHHDSVSSSGSLGAAHMSVDQLRFLASIANRQERAFPEVSYGLGGNPAFDWTSSLASGFSQMSPASIWAPYAQPQGIVPESFDEFQNKLFASREETIESPRSD